ncbi:MAG: tetratricopeptide repeat protein [Planctomycetes bacterium]|nr:tetratricopeptide repeat protein [Planctomycetota bacterium]
MKKTKCVLCNEVKAKRNCKERNDALICPKCCASIRNQKCEGCVHYEYAERYYAAQFHDSGKSKSAVKVDRGIERKADDALVLLEKGNMVAAKTQMNELLSMYPEDHSVQFGMGVVYASQDKFDEAISHFDRAIEIFPYYTQAYYNKVVALQKKSDMVNCLKTLKKLLAVGGEKDDFVMIGKNMLYEYEKYIMKNFGVDTDAYLACEKKFEEAFGCMENCQWEKAITYFQECTAILKKHAPSWGNMGLCYAHLGKREQALLSIDKAIEIDPLYEIAYVNRKAVEKLKEGEKLVFDKSKTAGNEKEFTGQNKS